MMSYSKYFVRQIPVIGKACQERLKKSSVLIAGMGGLGSTVATILTRNGISSLYVVDDDVVDETNIHRQILYSIEDVGKKKVEIAKRRLEKTGFSTEIHPIFQKVEKNFRIPKVDVVIDCLDNGRSKTLLSELAAKESIPFVHAGVNGYVGQILTLKKKTLSDVLSFPEDMKETPVLLQVISLVASIQAMEVVNLICEKPNNLIGKILFVDLLDYDFEVVNVEDV